MTTTIPAFGNSAGANNVGNGLFTEGLAPERTTDNLRQLQAAIRQQWNQSQWFAVGDLSGPATFTFLSASRFRVNGISLASQYHIGRRVRATGASTGTITGTITAVDGSGGNTDVTALFDSGELEPAGALQNETLTIELGSASALNSSIPGRIDHSVTFNKGLLSLTTITSPVGPFSPVSAQVISPRGGSDVVAIPITTRQLIIEVFGAGSSGNANDTPIEFNGSNIKNGTPGGVTTVSPDTGTFAMSITGGRETGGTRAGRLITPDASSVSNATAGYALVFQGMPGGNGPINGTDGLPGSYGYAAINLPTFTQLTISGGAGGAASSNEGGGAGSEGADASVSILFLE